MSSIVLLGARSSHGGRMITASGTTKINGQQVCVSGDIHECPIHGHGNTAVTSNSNVTDGNRPVIRVGDVAGCGAVIEEGSPNVFAN